MAKKKKFSSWMCVFMYLTLIGFDKDGNEYELRYWDGWDDIESTYRHQDIYVTEKSTTKTEG